MIKNKMEKAIIKHILLIILYALIITGLALGIVYMYNVKNDVLVVLMSSGISAIIMDIECDRFYEEIDRIKYDEMKGEHEYEKN